MKKIKFPSAQTILLLIAAFVALLTWCIPSGQYDRLAYNKEDNSFIKSSKDNSITLEASQKTLDDLESILKFNINVNDIYIKYLKPISNYKIQELIDIAQSKNIDIKINGKKRTKLDLYNEINMKVIP